MGPDLRAARHGLLFLALLQPWTGTFLRAIQSARRYGSLDQARRAAPWSIAPAEGVPQADTINGRSAAEVALDLSRVFTYLSAHGSVKVRKNGLLSTPVLRAMEKAVPLDKGSDFRLPDPHGFLFELLRQAGAVRIQWRRGIGRSRRDDAADRPVQPHAGAYLGARLALDARLVRRLWNSRGQRTRALAMSVRSGRQVLAWTLGCLARAGDHWYDLTGFIETLYANLRHVQSPFSRPGVGVEPAVSGCPGSGDTGPRASAGVVVRSGGVWYANAVMVTLVALGLVERARLGQGGLRAARLSVDRSRPRRLRCPEIAPPPEPAERRCLVIQPNFDIVAYLDQADARTAGLLGRIAERATPTRAPSRRSDSPRRACIRRRRAGWITPGSSISSSGTASANPPPTCCARSPTGRGNARACRSAPGSRCWASPPRPSAMRT